MRRKSTGDVRQKPRACVGNDRQKLRQYFFQLNELSIALPFTKKLWVRCLS
jgi:hypothetical protein